MRRESRRVRALSLGALALMTVSCPGTPASAAVLAEDELEETSTELGAVARAFGFVLAGEVLEPPYNLEDANPAATNIIDLRPYFSHRSERYRLVLHQSLVSSSRSHRSLGLFAFGRGVTPPRMLPLRHVFSDSPTLTLQTETDWAYAAFVSGPLTFTLGRQPVTLGRGRIWRPWDIVSSFALTEVDTGYKPGVDAVRFDISPSERWTLTLLTSAGELQRDSDFAASDRGSSALARVSRGFDFGEIAGLAGRVRADSVVGWSALWDLGSLDLYAEATVTWLGADSLSSPAVERRHAAVPRGLLGASIKPTNELTLVPEIYYDGFGARRPRDYLPIALSERVAVGEQLVLGQLYAGAALDLEAHPLLHLTALSLANLLDGSGLLSLGTTYEAAANTRLKLGGYVPVGQRPDVSAGFAPKTELGMFPYFGFVELEVTL